MRKDSLTTSGLLFFSGNAPSTFTCPLVLYILNEDGSSSMTYSGLIKIIGCFFVFFYFVCQKIKQENNVNHLHLLHQNPERHFKTASPDDTKQ